MTSTATTPSTAPRPAGTGESPRARSGVLALTRVFNRLVLRLAGTSLLPLYGVLEHHGRRSGAAYRTPVVVRPTVDGFLVPMPWGEGTDWCRNVRTAGGCVVRWKGHDYHLVRPEVLADPAAARAGFSAFQRAAMARFGIDHSLRLHLRAGESRTQRTGAQEAAHSAGTASPGVETG